MKLELEDLKGAVEQNILSGLQAYQLWQFLEGRPEALNEPVTPRFKITLSQVAYYIGTIFIVAALAIYAMLSKDSLGYGGTLVLTNMVRTRLCHSRLHHLAKGFPCYSRIGRLALYFIRWYGFVCRLQFPHANRPIYYPSKPSWL